MRGAARRAAALILIFMLSVFCVPAAASDESADSRAENGETSFSSAEEILTALFGAVGEAEDVFGQDIYNILLIGADRRDKTWNGNSDAIIVASVNRTAKTISLISFMRDLGAEIPGYGLRKLNSAFAAGGAELLTETLESNYGVRAPRYVSVDFTVMADLVDALGGIEIEVRDEETELLNSLAGDVASDHAHDAPDPLPYGGTWRLNGDQAVAYCRIRMVGNNDYERTERHRKVLEQIIREIRSMEAGDAAAFLARALALVNHNFSAADIVVLTAQVPELLDFTVTESRVPFDGLYHTQNEMLLPDQPETNETIQRIIDGN